MLASTLRSAALPAFTRSAAAAARQAAPRLNAPAAAALAARSSSSSSSSRRAFASSSYHLARRFTKEHEWADFDSASSVATIGVTQHAANQLGDVVFVELHAKGSTVAQGDGFGTIESVKAVSELYAPLSGTVEEINSNVVDEPGLINETPESDGWIIKLKVNKPAEFDALLSEEQYKEFVVSE